MDIQPSCTNKGVRNHLPKLKQFLYIRLTNSLTVLNMGSNLFALQVMNFV
jgi:hypothetical protein